MEILHLKISSRALSLSLFSCSSQNNPFFAFYLFLWLTAAVATTVCYQQGMANPLTYSMEGSNSVSVNNLTYQTIPTQPQQQQQQQQPSQQQATPLDNQLVQNQQSPPQIAACQQPTAMQALAGMAANSGYQIFSQPQPPLAQGSVVQGSPTSQQPPQQQQTSSTVVTLPPVTPPQTQHTDYSTDGK